MGTKAYTIADLHLKHPGVTRFRNQFATADEHDAFVVDRINSVVNKNDSLYILGDCVVGQGAGALIEQLCCQRVFLIPGNHDGERSVIPFGVFSRVMGSYARKLPGTNLGAVFTHIPVHPCCLDRWQLNVHGHLHDLSVDDPRYFCVSAERLDYTPISMEELGQRFLAQLGG